MLVSLKSLHVIARSPGSRFSVNTQSAIIRNAILIRLYLKSVQRLEGSDIINYYIL